MDSKTLKDEISKRAPWYQRITFPSQGVSTTDNPANAYPDQAWDNKIGDITIQEATRLRPEPKWRAIKDRLPTFANKDVLEIGCNCGFWSFYFASQGATRVTGLDVSPVWLENANWAKSVLGHDNVEFHNVDFMSYNGAANPRPGLLSDLDSSVPLPNRSHDIVFMSTVLDHLFFPLFAIYKMFRIARQHVIIDVPQLKHIQTDSLLMQMGVPADKSHHGFVFNKQLLLTYFERLGVPPDDVETVEYNDGANACYVIDVGRRNSALRGA